MDDKEQILSESEVESLLGSLAPAEAAPAARPREHQAAKPKLKVTPYDFKRPERVGKEQMRALQSLHEGFGRNFGSSLSALLRTVVEVKLTSVDQLTFAEFVFGLEVPTCFIVLDAEPLKGNFIVDINPSILYPMLDRMLGGGKEEPVMLRRPMTEIERRLSQRITSLFLEHLQHSWSNVIELEFNIIRLESNPQLVSIVPPNEVVVLIGFEIAMHGLRGLINLCIPYNSIERFSSTLVANSWSGYGRGTVNSETQAHIGMEVEQSEAELVVTLATSRITTSELLGLRVGDVITTNHDIHAPLTVSVGAQERFLGMPGAIKGKKAVQIQEVVPPIERPKPNKPTTDRAEKIVAPKS
ncbi:MAG: flagellar motor switch protein FliM [Planctomycetaceae bacterium]|nr:flagellar motor switch protein FliM [Planctomycetaceae bacterium]